MPSIRSLSRSFILLVASALLLLIPATALAAHDRLGARQLLPGMKGRDVKLLQRALSAVGYRTFADGEFGPGTAKNVRQFRVNAGLDASARFNLNVHRALKQAMKGGRGDVRRLGLRTLHYGQMGNDVRILQKLLSSLGHTLDSDAEFGHNTLRAIKNYEGETGLHVDGTVGSREAGLIGRAAAKLGERRAAPAAPAPPATAPAAPAPTAPAAPATTPGAAAQLGADGLAIAPADAPQQIKDMIAAGNRIAKTPYIYGGGHRSFDSPGYDCSGSDSYVLHAGGFVDSPKSSYDFYGWGEAGPGQWVTIYANDGHMYMTVAGLRFDTSAVRENGSRWTSQVRSPAGFTVRHPSGY